LLLLLFGSDQLDSVLELCFFVWLGSSWALSLALALALALALVRLLC